MARYTRRRKQASNAWYTVADGRFPFGERDRHGADKKGVRNGEYVKRDRGFESGFLQQPVCLSGEPRGCKRKAPQFGGGLRVAGDVRRGRAGGEPGPFALSL